MYLDWVSSGCRNASSPPELSTITASFSFVLLIVTVPTNLFVCLAITIDRNKELRTQFSCFTFNLALADLLVGCITESLGVYIHIRQSLDTGFGHTDHLMIQKLIHIPYFIASAASILSISALAVERWLAVTSPFFYRQYFNVKLSVVLSLGIWIVALSYGIMNIWLDYILENFIFVNTAFLVTGIVVCFACFKIRSTLKQVSQNLELVGLQSSQRNDNEIQNRLTKTFALMIGGLMCCYIPACTAVYYMNLCSPCNCDVIEWLRDLVFWLVLLNSAIDPFIYALRTSQFRSAVRNILSCKCKKRGNTVQQKFIAKFIKGHDKQSAKLFLRQEGYGSTSTDSTSLRPT